MSSKISPLILLLNIDVTWIVIDMTSMLTSPSMTNVVWSGFEPVDTSLICYRCRGFYYVPCGNTMVWHPSWRKLFHSRRKNFEGRIHNMLRIVRQSKSEGFFFRNTTNSPLPLLYYRFIYYIFVMLSHVASVISPHFIGKIKRSHTS